MKYHFKMPYEFSYCGADIYNEETDEPTRCGLFWGDGVRATCIHCRVRAETMQGASARMIKNTELLGACWRSSWHGFDGRKLKHQLAQIDKPVAEFAEAIGGCLKCWTWLDDCECSDPEQSKSNVVKIITPEMVMQGIEEQEELERRWSEKEGT